MDGERVAEQKPVKSKRRVRNPETFREKALKASETAGRPRQAGPVRRLVGGILSAIFKPIGRLLKTVFTTAPFRLLGRLLRPVGKILFVSYFRNSWQELKQVTWPDWRQSRQLTLAVLIFAFVFGAAIAGVDWGLDKVFRNVLLK